MAALEKGKDGERYALASGTYKFVDYVRAVKEEFEPLGYKIDDDEYSKCTIWLMSFINEDAKNYLWQWNIRIELN